MNSILHGQSKSMKQSKKSVKWQENEEISKNETIQDDHNSNNEALDNL